MLGFVRKSRFPTFGTVRKIEEGGPMVEVTLVLEILIENVIAGRIDAKVFQAMDQNPSNRRIGHSFRVFKQDLERDRSGRPSTLDLIKVGPRLCLLSLKTRLQYSRKTLWNL